jgi:hypothetical protein
MSVGVSAVFGFLLILCLLFSVQNFDDVVGSSYEQPVLQILLDIFGENGAIILFTLIIVCVWHCGLFSITSNSRMMVSTSTHHDVACHLLSSLASPVTAACPISSITSMRSYSHQYAQFG